MALALLLVPSTAVADEPSVETATLQEIFDAMSSDPVLDSWTGAPVEAERARAHASTRQPGFSMGAGLRWIVDVEQEVEVEVGREFPLDGVRKREREAILKSADALEYDGQSRLLERRADVADHFYRAALQRDRIEMLRLRREAVERARASLARREQAGDVSAYELERMEREVRRAELAIRRAETDMDVALGQLAAIVGTKGYGAVEGNLAPEVCGGSPEALPQAQAIVRRVESAEVRREAAARGWIPSLQTGVGWVGVAEGGEFQNGVFAGLGIAFPFWAYGSHAEDAESARIVELNAESKLLRRTTDTLAATYAAQCARLLELATESERSVEASQKLLTRAEAGYAAAELSLLELVDAQTALLEDRIQHIELLAAARQAQNDWMRVTGGWQ